MLTKCYYDGCTATSFCGYNEFTSLTQKRMMRSDGTGLWVYSATRQSKCNGCRNLRGLLASGSMKCRCGNPYIYRGQKTKIWNGQKWINHSNQSLLTFKLVCSTAVPLNY